MFVYRLYTSQYIFIETHYNYLMVCVPMFAPLFFFEKKIFDLLSMVPAQVPHKF